jgi:hypothetical protein
LKKKNGNKKWVTVLGGYNAQLCKAFSNQQSDFSSLANQIKMNRNNVSKASCISASWKNNFLFFAILSRLARIIVVAKVLNTNAILI